MLSNTSVPLSVDFDSPEDFFVFTFHILFATSSVLVAGSVVIAIFSTKVLRAQNRFVFMLNTSIGDTFTGLSVYYLGLFDVQEGYPSRNGTYYILPSFLGVNMLTFLFAQFDRYFAVCHPFFYKRYITRSFVIAICCLCWIYTYTIVAAQNLVPISKAAEINAFGVICFLSLWGPSFVNIIVRQLTRRGLRFRNEATNLFAIMARMNALVTPALYIWGSPALREAVWGTVWRRVCPKRR